MDELQTCFCVPEIKVETVLTALRDEPRALDEMIMVVENDCGLPTEEAVDGTIEILDEMLGAGWVEVRRGLLCLTTPGRHKANSFTQSVMHDSVCMGVIPTH